MNTFHDMWETKRKIKRIFEWIAAIVIVSSICYIIMHIVLAIQIGAFK